MEFKDTMDSMIDLFSVDDKKFDAIYNDVKTQALESCRGRAAQRDMLDNMSEDDALFFNDDKEIEAIIQAMEEETKKPLSKNKKEFLKESLKISSEINKKIVESGKEQIRVKVELVNETAKLPTYANPTDAGADIYSNEEITINPGETKIVKTGLKVSMPKGYMINIYNRSGQAFKTKLRVANSVGIIDYLYHKEIGVVLDNIGTEPITIHIGDRIAQMIIQQIPMIEWQTVDKVEETERSGFGSTGTK